MQRQAPTFGRLFTMAVFALSCFGLLLYLWLSFGGAIPLKPRATASRWPSPRPRSSPSRPTSGWPGSGSARSCRGPRLGPQPDGGDDRGRSEVRADPRRRPGDPPPEDPARRDLRRDDDRHGRSPTIPEGGTLANSRIGRAVTLDQVVQAFDPVTREAFRNWQRDLAGGSAGRGATLNDALGNLPGFVAGAGDVLDVLNAQSAAVTRLVRNAGVVFGAISQDRSSSTTWSSGRTRRSRRRLRAAGAGGGDRDPADLPRRDEGDAGPAADLRPTPTR